MDKDFEKWVLSEGDPIEDLVGDDLPLNGDILPSDCTLPDDVDIIWAMDGLGLITLPFQPLMG